MAEDVNEAGADHQACGVYYLTRRLRRNAPGRRDLEDALATDGDISVEPGIAGTIDDFRSVDQNVNVEKCH